jgi:WD40 repeat protein
MLARPNGGLRPGGLATSVSDRQLLTTLQGHTGFVWSAVFSPDDQRIVTASDDKIARVFRVVTLSEIAKLLAK